MVILHYRDPGLFFLKLCVIYLFPEVLNLVSRLRIFFPVIFINFYLKASLTVITAMTLDTQAFKWFSSWYPAFIHWRLRERGKRLQKWWEQGKNYFDMNPLSLPFIFYFLVPDHSFIISLLLFLGWLKAPWPWTLLSFGSQELDGLWLTRNSWDALFFLNIFSCSCLPLFQVSNESLSLRYMSFILILWCTTLMLFLQEFSQTSLIMIPNSFSSSPPPPSDPDDDHELTPVNFIIIF